jgi:hypothetical protein
VPKAAVSTCSKKRLQKPDLLDHLVGDCEQARRKGEVERPRRLQVDDELEFGRLLDRQALLALENATDIDADSAPYVRLREKRAASAPLIPAVMV